MLKRFKQDYPKYKNFFQFPQFNQVQAQCYTKIFNSKENIIVSAPTGSGKTVLFELLILKNSNQMKTKCLYLAPIKSLCQEKTGQWKQKFHLKMNVMELTGDTLQMEAQQIQGADIYIATPQKIDYISRKNLNFLKQLNLLLIDEIHMLNMQDRGAILQAIVTRIISINKNIRVMAVSATIPNIKEVALWLKVPKQLICVFGNQYRPVKLHKVVLGFKSTNNDFNFQKMLNFKVLQVIRQYSVGGGTLIFCQTQKGTEQACSKIIGQAKQRQFIDSQNVSKNLIQASKIVDSSVLKTLIPQGVAFHNASLSMKDRSIVQKLFLDLKVKVLCTTSTLAMGINLPARLVIIKSTKCYKGAGKGYQEYNQIQIDQMMGRAGRIPFDIQGTVVIMTQKQNYNKYLGDIRLQNLQSQLFSQLIDHLNTQISLKSIQSLIQAEQYFKNSFCFITMQKDPKKFKDLLGKHSLQSFIKENIQNQILKLSSYNIIQYLPDNGKIYPRQCSFNIARNAVQVETIIKIIQNLNNIMTERQFIQLLCKANQFGKFRSKLDERKCLKELNQKIKYSLKQTISTSQKKTFILLQAQLCGIHIQSWEMRKQSKQMVAFSKRLVYCIKYLALQRKSSHKNFWLYLYSCLFYKYCTIGFCEQNQCQILKQINRVQFNWKNITARGIRTLQDLILGLDKLDIFGVNVSSVNLKEGIQQQLSLIKNCIQISIKKVDQKNNQNNYQFEQTTAQSYVQKNTNHMLKLIFTKNFTQKLKSVNIIIQMNNFIYYSGIITKQNPQFNVFLKNTSKQKYFLAIIKQGYVGFDQFYMIQNGCLKKTFLKKQNQLKNKIRPSQKINLNKFDYSKQKQIDSENRKRGRKQKSLEPVSVSGQLKTKNDRAINSSYQNDKRKVPKKVTYQFTDFKQQSQLFQFNDPYKTKSSKKKELKILDNEESNVLNEQNSNTLKIKRSKQLTLTKDFNTVKRKYIYEEDNQETNPLSKQLKKPVQKQKVIKYGDLKSYNWKPGFEKIKDDGYNQKAYYQNNFSLNSFLESEYQSDKFNTINKFRNKNLNQNKQQSPLNQRILLLNDQEEQIQTKFQNKFINKKPFKQDIKQELNDFMNNKLQEKYNKYNMPITLGMITNGQKKLTSKKIFPQNIKYISNQEKYIKQPFFSNFYSKQFHKNEKKLEQKGPIIFQRGKRDYQQNKKMSENKISAFDYFDSFFDNQEQFQI